MWSVLENLLGQYGQGCIVTGCVVTPHAGGSNYDITAGIVLLQDGSGNWHYAKYAGGSNISLPKYFVLSSTTTNALYHDSISKPIIVNTTAILQSGLPGSGGYLQLTSAGAATWRDIIQDSSHRMVTDANIAAWNAAASIKPGFVMFQAMSTIPTGWFECDGSTVSRTVYAALFAAIGTTYGAGDGSTTFKLPDGRGYFVRGFDHGAGIDTGRALGSTQADSFAAHTHVIKRGDAYTGSSDAGFAYVGGGQHGNPQPDVTALSTGSSETRPLNIAFVMIIKY